MLSLRCLVIFEKELCTLRMILSKKITTIRATGVVLIPLFPLNIVSEQKTKMNTQNTVAPSYHSKASSTQNKGVPFFSFVGHVVQYYISCHIRVTGFIFCLKGAFLMLHTALHYFICSRVKASQIAYGRTIRAMPSKN